MAKSKIDVVAGATGTPESHEDIETAASQQEAAKSMDMDEATDEFANDTNVGDKNPNDQGNKKDDIGGDDEDDFEKDEKADESVAEGATDGGDYGEEDDYEDDEDSDDDEDEDEEDDEDSDDDEDEEGEKDESLKAALADEAALAEAELADEDEEIEPLEESAHPVLRYLAKHGVPAAHAVGFVSELTKMLHHTRAANDSTDTGDEDSSMEHSMRAAEHNMGWQAKSQKISRALHAKGKGHMHGKVIKALAGIAQSRHATKHPMAEASGESVPQKPADIKAVADTETQQRPGKEAGAFVKKETVPQKPAPMTETEKLTNNVKIKALIEGMRARLFEQDTIIANQDKEIAQLRAFNDAMTVYQRAQETAVAVENLIAAHPVLESVKTTLLEASTVDEARTIAESHLKVREAGGQKKISVDNINGSKTASDAVSSAIISEGIPSSAKSADGAPHTVGTAQATPENSSDEPSMLTRLAQYALKPKRS